MATAESPVSTPTRVFPDERISLLHNGDRLSGPEFERRYMAMPEVRKAQLIEGVVYMPSPVSTDHSIPHNWLGGWAFNYMVHTPGIDSGNDGTIRLDLKNRPQPDLMMWIRAQHGGQSRVEDRYVLGAPELVAEVAASTVSYDLHDKLEAYRRNGVREYIVWRVEDGELDYFILRDGAYERLQPSDGVYKSEVFPGLWLDAAALLRGDLVRLVDVATLGRQTPEHAAFVERLRQAQ